MLWFNSAHEFVSGWYMFIYCVYMSRFCTFVRRDKLENINLHMLSSNPNTFSDLCLFWNRWQFNNWKKGKDKNIPVESGLFVIKTTERVLLFSGFGCSSVGTARRIFAEMAAFQGEKAKILLSKYHIPVIELTLSHICLILFWPKFLKKPHPSISTRRSQKCKL